jgi:hypothetical protein
MFSSDNEKKIIDIVKKSPLGLTSSEIAKYLGINRVTLTKYLAVIKEKTLIDFKQFGMAKLWYVPVKLNKEVFFNEIIDALSLNLSKTDSKVLFEKAGIGFGEKTNTMYLDFYKVKSLNLDRVADVLIDIGNKVGGTFKLKLKSEEKIILEVVKNPFEDRNKEVLNNVLNGLFGKIASLNFGYSRTMIEKAKENGEEKEFLTVYLKKKE